MECRFAQAAGPGGGKGFARKGQGLRAQQGPRVPEPQPASGRDDQVPVGQGSHDHFPLLPSLLRPPGKGQRLLDQACPLQPPLPWGSPSSWQHLARSFPATPSLWRPSVPPGAARPPFQSFLETLSPNRRPQTFGPLALRTQGPSPGPGAFCCPASELSALPRGLWPSPHTRRTELEAWLCSQSGNWFHSPCRSSVAHKGQTKYEARPLVVWLPSASPALARSSAVSLSTCAVPGTLPT